MNEKIKGEEMKNEDGYVIRRKSYGPWYDVVLGSRVIASVPSVKAGEEYIARHKAGKVSE